MYFSDMRRTVRYIAFAAAAMSLSGCNLVKRLNGVGTEPVLTTIQNPVQAPTYKPVTMPMPEPQISTPRRARPSTMAAASAWA